VASRTPRAYLQTRPLLDGRRRQRRCPDALSATSFDADALEVRDDDVLQRAWFWNAIATVIVAAGFVCVYASTQVDLPGCREVGRTRAEDHATSFVGGAFVAAALAVIVVLAGRSRASQPRWRTVTMLALPVALFICAFASWLAMDFPCAGD
jgi:hypothetical protein